MSYLAEKGKYYLFYTGTVLAFNLYFIFLVPGVDRKYLYYLDFLVGLCAVFFAGSGYLRHRQRERKKKSLLGCGDVIFREIEDLRDRDVAEHDVGVLERQLEEQFEENCELQDYVAKWCHEIKIPLAAGMLVSEEMRDAEQKSRMREQLERMNRNLNALLLGCKLQSSLFDLQIRRVDLEECARTSVKNNQFFLIQKHFQIDIDMEGAFVYTDPSWIVYVLDQLIGNAVKYASEKPKLLIRAERGEHEVRLIVRDNGEGIQKSDLRRIFEKGYVGNNNHNGKYKSTGMGLYMVSKILERLGHEISVESGYGEYTQFTVVFRQ